MFKEPSFLKKANLFQPILVVVISIIGGTPMEGANTGKIVLLVILGAAFIVWHVECQRLINRNREMKKQACTLKNRSAALYKKTYAALSGAGQEVCAALLHAATTDACIEILDKAGLRAPVLAGLVDAIQTHLDRRAAGAFRVGAILFSNQHGPLGQTQTAKELLQAWTM